MNAALTHQKLGRLLSLNDQGPFLDVMIQTVHPRTPAETVARGPS
jgi:hypothetical protein